MKSNDVINFIIKCLLVTLVLMLAIHTSRVSAQCGGSCSACTKKYGCMTAAWGQCCTQFYMHNGKRSALSDGYNSKNIDRVIEYIRLRSQEFVDPEENLNLETKLERRFP